MPYDENGYKAKLGLNALFGEPGYTTQERAWARPTLEVNGIYGGFQGEGVKTIIPSQAHAKITCRLVADQNPHHILELIQAHIEKHTPPGVVVTVTLGGSTADPYLMPADHPANAAADTVLSELYGKKPY